MSKRMHAPEVRRGGVGARCLLLLGVGLAACATVGPGDIPELSARGEVGELLRLYPRLERASDRAALLEALAPHVAGHEAARRLLLDAAEAERTPAVRGAALKALGSASVPGAGAVLIAGLGDPHPTVRVAARAAIQRRGPELQDDLRRAVIVDPNHLIRATSLELLAAEARSRRELAASIATLALRAIDDTSPLVRAEAVESLGLLRHGPARPILVERLRTDASREVRMAAEKALERVGRSEAAPRATVAVLPLRVDGEDPDGRLRRLADRLAEIARARLSAAAVCEVVDRDKMQAVLSELKKKGQLVYDGDAVNAPAIGKFKIANQLVYGSVLKQGPVHTIVLQRLDVSTLELVPGAAVSLSGYASELDRLVDETVERFIRGFR